MVTVREQQPLSQDGSVDIEFWLCKLHERSPGLNLGRVREVCELSEQAEEKAIATNTVWAEGHSSFRIGLEMAENLRRRGLDVTMVELSHQVMPPLDPEMAYPVEQRLREEGVDLRLGDAVSAFAERDGRLRIATRSGAEVDTDLAILAVGVRPEVKLAEEAGLALGEIGGIRVDAAMRTNDPAIFAVGDATESRDFLTGRPRLLALAGPANRQGRMAADAICGFVDSKSGCS